MQEHKIVANTKNEANKRKTSESSHFPPSENQNGKPAFNGRLETNFKMENLHANPRQKPPFENFSQLAEYLFFIPGSKIKANQGRDSKSTPSWPDEWWVMADDSGAEKLDPFDMFTHLINLHAPKVSGHER